MFRYKCKKCSGKKFWNVRRGKLRCKSCRYEFVPKFGGIKLTRYQWRAISKWFLRCQSVNVVVEETGISKYRVLKSLTLVRQVMAVDIPEVFLREKLKLMKHILEVNGSLKGNLSEENKNIVNEDLERQNNQYSEF
jgi:hypothetical protein